MVIRSLINAMIATMIFFPSSDVYMEPQSVGLHPEDVTCVTKDKTTLHGWYFKGSSDLCLLFFHGNAGNITMRIPKIKPWLNKGVSVFLLDYRGYGKSKGKIGSAADLTQDAEAGLEWLKTQKKFSASHIILYGESIGAVPAIELATKEKFKAAIFEAPFTSIKDMAKKLYGMAPDFMLKGFEMDNEAKISKIKTPVLVVHGTEDDVVPFEMGKRVFDSAPEPKKFLPIEGAQHNNISEIGREKFFEEPYEFALKA